MDRKFFQKLWAKNKKEYDYKWDAEIRFLNSEFINRGRREVITMVSPCKRYRTLALEWALEWSFKKVTFVILIVSLTIILDAKIV
jgi:hypothetical protein